MKVTKGGILTAGIVALSATLVQLTSLAAQTNSNSSTNPRTVDFRTYAVSGKVADFPTNANLSTPEAAYVTITRAWVAEGIAAFSHLSVPEIASQISPNPKKPIASKEAEISLNAQLIEVSIFQETNAMVLARLHFSGKDTYDLRSLRFHNGQWLNQGQDLAGTPEEARARVRHLFSVKQAKSALASRPAITNSEQHLRPFVDFLRNESSEPQSFLLQALSRNQIVILGEVHHRPRYWAFDSALVQAKTFADQVGVIYLELPSNDQKLVEQFLAAPQYDPQPIITMLRDNLIWGWPDQSMLDFFKTVWQANQALPSDRRVRIVLVDAQAPWKEITRREDLKKFDVDRDRFMAQNVVSDLRAHKADPRHALFIIGYMHAMVNLANAAGDPVKSAGWHLRKELGATNVFAIFPHSPVIANMGGVNGRIGLGLFDTAFAALTNRPMAFPLDHGPFGDQIFDASLDLLTTDSFRNGYQAYLYLGPLENETFSALIPGFYTDEFVRDLDRRCRVLYGKGLETQGIARVDAEAFIQWMSRDWGQPRHDWSSRLGPLNAWELGSDWEKKDTTAKLNGWMQHKDDFRQAAQRLFDAIRQADYAKPGPWQTFPAPDVNYVVQSDAPGWQQWICQHFQTNPIVTVKLSDAIKQANGLPAVPYRVTLKNGEALTGTLPLEWDAYAQRWQGIEGLDWHLGKKKPSTPENRP